MFVRIKKSSSRKTAVQLVEGYRDAATGKVKQRIVRHLGYGDTEEEVSRLKTLGEHLKIEIKEELQPSFFGPTYSPAEEKKDEAKAEDYRVDDVRKLRTQNQVMTGVNEVCGHQFNKLGFNSILPNPTRKAYSQKVLKDIVLARIASPDSKRDSVRFLSEQCGIQINLDSVYNAMDYIDDKVIQNIQGKSLAAAQRIFPEKIDVLFYDATTLYFESFTEDELKSKGFSKDHKSQEVQILLSIFVTKHGIPVGYDIFPGSTYEGHTLLTALSNLKHRFTIDQVVFVADSGMLQKDNLTLLEANGYEYIVGARIKNMSKEVTDQILSEDGLSSIGCDSEDALQGKIIGLDKDKKLIVTYSKKRARKDAHNRDTALEKLKKALRKGKSAKSMLPNSGYKKYMQLEGQSTITVDQNKIDKDKKWDGLHGLVTNIPNVNMSEVVSHYKGLWQVEETFRVTKHDLKVRPIYHWTESRIKAHIALCFMALVCIRHMEYRIMLGNKKMSPKRIRDALSTVGRAHLVHTEDKRVFAVPFNPSDDAKAIYKINDMKLSTTPFLVSS